MDTAGGGSCRRRDVSRLWIFDPPRRLAPSMRWASQRGLTRRRKRGPAEGKTTRTDRHCKCSAWPSRLPSRCRHAGQGRTGSRRPGLGTSGRLVPKYEVLVSRGPETPILHPRGFHQRSICTRAHARTRARAHSGSGTASKRTHECVAAGDLEVPRHLLQRHSFSEAVSAPTSISELDFGGKTIKTKKFKRWQFRLALASNRAGQLLRRWRF